MTILSSRRSPHSFPFPPTLIPSPSHQQKHQTKGSLPRSAPMACVLTGCSLRRARSLTRLTRSRTRYFCAWMQSLFLFWVCTRLLVASFPTWPFPTHLTHCHPYIHYPAARGPPCPVGHGIQHRLFGDRRQPKQPHEFMGGHGDRDCQVSQRK